MQSSTLIHTLTQFVYIYIAKMCRSQTLLSLASLHKLYSTQYCEGGLLCLLFNQQQIKVSQMDNINLVTRSDAINKMKICEIAMSIFKLY